jgi:hypothetical protein
MGIDYNNLGDEDFVLMEFDGSDYSVDAYAAAEEDIYCLTNSYHVYFDDDYNNEYDEEINILLKKYKDLDGLNIVNSGGKKLNFRLLVVFNELDHIKYFQMIGSYFKKEEYKNFIILKNLKRFSIKVYDIRDIEFEKFEKLEECYMEISKQHSTKEQIEASVKHIEKLKKKYTNIEFKLDIQKY